jgi:hypothetical protein
MDKRIFPMAIILFIALISSCGSTSISDEDIAVVASQAVFLGTTSADGGVSESLAPMTASAPRAAFSAANSLGGGLTGDIEVDLSGLPSAITAGGSLSFQGWVVEYEDEQYEVDADLDVDWSVQFSLLDGMACTRTFNIQGDVSIQEGARLAQTSVDLHTVLNYQLTPGAVTVSCETNGTVGGRTVDRSFSITVQASLIAGT